MITFSKINDLLRHQTTTGIQFRELDSFRGWACLGILFLHSVGPTGKPAYYSTQLGFIDKLVVWPFVQGWAGLDLFFFLSGFLLFIRYGKAYYEGRPAPSVAAFYKRRFFRIAPAYYANVVIMTAVWYLIFSKYVWFRFDATNLFTHFIFMHNLSPSYSQSINPVLWTLAIEAQFYLVLPLMAGWFYGRRWLVAAPLILAGCALYKLGVLLLNDAYGVNQYMNLAQPPLNQLAWRLDQFVIGICFANLWLYMHYHRKESAFFVNKMYASLLTVAGFAVIIGSFVVWEHFIVTTNRVWMVVPSMLCVGFGMLILGSLNTGVPFRWVIANPVIEFVGIISFSVYLWHYPVLMYLQFSKPYLTEPGIEIFITRAAYVLPLSLIVGLVSYLLFEKPFIRRSGQSRPPAAALDLREIKAEQR